jgi:hypothetical protein
MDFTVIDSFFSDKKFPDKDVFKGYQLVKYSDGEYGIIYKSVGVKVNENERVAYTLESAHEKGIETEIRKTFESLKLKNLEASLEKPEKVRSFQLKENEQIVAQVVTITRDMNTGVAELRLMADQKKLILKIKNEHSRNLEEGHRISLNGTKEGIKINVLRERALTIGRSLS